MSVTFALVVSDGTAMRCVHPPAIPTALRNAIEDHIAASMVEPSRHPAVEAQDAMRPRAAALAPVPGLSWEHPAPHAAVPHMPTGNTRVITVGGDAAPPARALVTDQIAPPHTPAPSDEIRRQAMARAARDQGFSGDICDQCGGGQMKRSGTCLTCQSCGSTTGCS